MTNGANAGKIAIVPKGDYNRAVAYEKLNLVTYKGESWIAKKPCVGIEPNRTNSAYWHRMAGHTAVNNLTTTEAGFVLDARQGKILMDAINETNGNLEAEISERESAVAEAMEQIAQIANNQIPQEYLESAVDAYVTENSGGFATRDALDTVEADLKSDLIQLDNNLTTLENDKLSISEAIAPKKKNGKVIEVFDSWIKNGLKILSYSKNLLPSYTANGNPSATPTVAVDISNCTYKFNGSTGSSGAMRADNLFRQNRVNLKAGTYTVSVDSIISQQLTLYINQLSNNNDLVAVKLYSEKEKTFTLSEDKEVFISFNSTSQQTYENTLIRVMLVEGIRSVPFVPSADIALTINSSNLFDSANFVQREGYSNLVLAENGKTSDRIRITGYDSGGRFACFNIKTTIGEKYTFSYEPFTGNGISAIYFKESDTLPSAWLGFGTKVIPKGGFTYIASEEYIQIAFELNAKNAYLDNVKFERGTKKEYERYKSTVVTLPYDTEKVVDISECGNLLTLSCDYDIVLSYACDSEKAIEQSQKKWKDKVWCPVGDSLTDKMVRCRTNYHDYIHEETGIAVVNFGASGTGYVGGSDGQHFYQRVAELAIYADADVVTIFGSGNDVSLVSNNTYPLGTASDTIENGTYAGYVNECLDKIFENAPHARVGIISPTPWIQNMPYKVTTFSQISDMLKQIADRRGIPFLDLFRTSGFRVDNEDFVNYYFTPDVDTTLTADGVHPNSLGQKWIASQIKAFIGSMIY